jgi:hypothetical protein
VIYPARHSTHSGHVLGGTGLRPVVSGVARETVCDDDYYFNDRYPHATFPHEIWRDAKLNRRDACSTQNHTGGVLAQTEA